MNEIIFLVEEAPEGGYSARALGVEDHPRWHESVIAPHVKPEATFV